MKAHTEKTPEITSENILFDADATNTIYYIHEQNNKEYRVAHIWSPVDDKRFFQLCEESLKAAKKVEKDESLNLAFFAPNVKIWDEFVVDRQGFKSNPDDWKEKTSDLTKSNSTKKYFNGEVVTKEKVEASADDLPDDSEETFETYLNVVQNGVLIGTVHRWREETQTEMDEYLAILANAPRKNALASAKKVTLEERYCDLYDAACIEQENYKERVPAWHKEKMAKQFFSERFLLLGK